MRFKHPVTIISIVCIMFLIAGCEPERITTAITGGVDQAHYQATDPCSPVQVTAEQLKQITDSAAILITTAVATTGFPYAKAILGSITVIQAILGLILSWRKKQTQTALEEVVIGNEALKAKLDDTQQQDFKDAQAAAQSAATQIKIAEIRNNIDA